MPSVRMAANRAVKVDVDVEGMVALIREAGTGRFIEAMLDFCRKSVGADFVSIFAYSGASTPYLVGTATTTAAENARKAAVGYMEHFASDVNFGLVSRRRAGTYVTYQTADEIASSQYRHACYDRTGIADRLSLLSVGPVRSTSVSVYRSRGNGRFSDRELDRAGALLPILMASADLHGGVKEVISAPRNGTIEEMQASLRSRHPRMTVRELEVAARVKTGMSARQIAVELGIAETTVITHRNSAYVRMGVANLRELLLA
jgi:LuxR family transcriptional regulator, activator of tox operons